MNKFKEKIGDIFYIPKHNIFGKKIRAIYGKIKNSLFVEMIYYIFQVIFGLVFLLVGYIVLGLIKLYAFEEKRIMKMMSDVAPPKEEIISEESLYRLP